MGYGDLTPIRPNVSGFDFDPPSYGRPTPKPNKSNKRKTHPQDRQKIDMLLDIARQAQTKFETISEPVPQKDYNTVRGKIKKLQELLPKYSTKILKKEVSSQNSSDVNKAAYNAGGCISHGQIEELMDSIPHINPSNSTMVDVNYTGSSGTLQRHQQSFDVHAISKLVITNNYQMPTDIRVYVFKCASNTTTDVLPFLNGHSNDVGFSQSPDSAKWQDIPNAYPSDIYQELGPTKEWRLEKSWSQRLNPGDSMTCVHNDQVEYNAAQWSELSSATYLKGVDTRWVFRHIGTLAHGDLAANPVKVGYSDTSIDLMFKYHYKVKYRSLLPGTKAIEIDNTYGAITNAGTGVEDATKSMPSAKYIQQDTS